MAIYIGLNPRVARTMNDITCIKGYSLRPLGSLFPNKKFLDMFLGCVCIQSHVSMDSRLV